MRIRSGAWLALILSFLVAARPESAAQPPTAPDLAAVANAPPARQERPADRRDTVLQALRKRVSTTFDKIPVVDALGWLRRELGLNLYVDTAQIDAHGLSERLAGEVTLAVHDVTGRVTSRVDLE